MQSRSFRSRQPRDLALDQVEITCHRGKTRPLLVDPLPYKLPLLMHPSCQKMVAQS